jgi:hypothetical protein
MRRQASLGSSSIGVSSVERWYGVSRSATFGVSLRLVVVTISAITYIAAGFYFSLHHYLAVGPPASLPLIPLPLFPSLSLLWGCQFFFLWLGSHDLHSLPPFNPCQLTQVLFLASKDVSSSMLSAVFFQLVNWLQMIIFPLVVLLHDDVAPNAERQSGVAGFVDVVGTLSAGAVVAKSASVFWPLFSIALAWVVIYLGLFFQVGRSFVSERPQSPMLLRILRSVATLSSTILFIPIIRCVSSRPLPLSHSPIVEGGACCT